MLRFDCGARRVFSLVVVLSVLVGVGSMGMAGSALASGVLSAIGSFGGPGTGAGLFETPRGVAVDSSAGSSKGDVYVVDQNNHRFEKFDALGDFLFAVGDKVNQNGSGICKAGEECQEAETGTGAGQFGAALNKGGIAVDPVNGEVFMADVNNHRIQKFSSEGDFELMFGDKVNQNGSDVCKAGEECQAGTAATTAAEEEEGKFPSWSSRPNLIAISSAGTVYVGADDRIQEFNSAGVYQAQIALPAGVGTVTQLAVNESDDVFVKTSSQAGVHEYNSAGVELAEFDTGSTAITAVAFDAVSKDLYVDETSPTPHVIEYAANGSVVAESPENALGEEPSTGMAVTNGGTVYAADEAANSVVMLGAAPTEGVPPPTVTSLPLAQDGSRGVQVQGDVNPHFSAETKYWVEYGTSVSYGGRAPVAPSVLYLTGGATNSPQIASAVLEGLQPETEYHYRFVAEATTGTTYGPDAVFVTDAEGITGLPDGRVYEQVTPENKNGNFFDAVTHFLMGLAAANGESVLYPMSGAVGSASTGIVDVYVSHHVAGGGWTTTQTTPRPIGQVTESTGPAFILPSSEFTRFLFEAQEPYAPGDTAKFANIFLSEGVGREATWLTDPQVSDPIPAPGTGTSEIGIQQDYAIAGASPNLDQVYFSYAGTLLPEDAERAAHVGTGSGTGEGLLIKRVDPWGFYEWNNGVLQEAGTLPNKKVNPFGAVPAGFGFTKNTGSRAENYQAGDFDNTVSENGSRAFFVSPDPLASKMTDPEGCTAEPANCTSEPPELYVREVGANGVAKVSLVSKSELPGSEGNPSAHGPAAVANLTYSGNRYHGATYAFPSPDGSQAFFASVDRLTSAAPENSALKEYDYDVETGSLTYLPDVEGAISTVNQRGTAFMFVNEKSKPWELEVWRAGTAGGSVHPIVALPEAAEMAEVTKKVVGHAPPRVRSAHASVNGSVFVFSTDSPIEGFNNGGEAGELGHGGANRQSPLEVYRFDAETSALNCISCPPKGITPAGDAYMSYNNYETEVGEEVPHQNGAGNLEPPTTTQETRGMSANGSQIFFDTPSPLVSQAVNGKRDVYEWENGHVYLLSSGTSSQESYYLDNSESGDDVFFATSAGLVPGDTDDAYDVYDARVPRPGDTSPPSVPPCKGSVCQGPPSVPQLLGAPASETFNGAGNVTPAAEKAVVKSVVKKKAKPKKKKKKSKRSKGKGRHKSKKASKSDRGAKR